MPTQLVAPINVTTTKTGDKTIKVSWEDKNAANKVAEYKISFFKKKNPENKFIPDNVPTPSPGTSSDGVTPYSVVITWNGDQPTAAELVSSYVAQVVDKPANTTEDSDSEPGLQAYWEVTPSLTVRIGRRSFTLTKGSGKGGVYRLPVSEEHPLTIDIQDIKALARAAGLSEDIVPSKWPNDKPITSSLNIYRLAIDTNNKLLDLEIAAHLDFEPVPGLTVEKVGLSVVRTDGKHDLYADDETE